MENIPVHIIPCVVCVPIWVRVRCLIEEKRVLPQGQDLGFEFNIVYILAKLEHYPEGIKDFNLIQPATN